MRSSSPGIWLPPASPLDEGPLSMQADTLRAQPSLMVPIHLIAYFGVLGCTLSCDVTTRLIHRSAVYLRNRRNSGDKSRLIGWKPFPAPVV
jgi:hypothetical protein